VTDPAIEITADLIAELLREQHPDLAGLPLTFGARGWDNQLWRLGDAVREVWDDALAAPDWTGPALWLHGDLHPANLLTRDGNFCGVADFGDMCAGDPACDLAACWILLPDGVIDRFHQSYSPAVGAATLRRARGWALSKALVCLLIGDAGVHGRPGGKATWGPPADASLQRLIATRP
jgi:aminoglycoside phosphotransferase (APT) family kinase protein